MNDPALARRYARALFELASHQRNSDAVEKSLGTFVEAIKRDRTATLFFESPMIALEEKQHVLVRLLENKTSPLILRFLLLLVANNRFALLQAILEAYHTLSNESRGLQEILITTARPLKRELVKTIEKVMAQQTGHSIISETRVDPSLLGGVRIQIRNRLLDGSIQTKLNILKKEMMGIHA